MHKALIVAPFWGISGHVGNHRVDRFIRWLGASGIQVVLVRAGGSDRAREVPWGIEVTVRDPLGLYRDPIPGSGTAAPSRRPNRLRRDAANFIFNPDPTVVWASRAAQHPLAIEHASKASFVISSGPPESCHVCAARLAKRIKSGLIVDMRDGWLDEPLKPLLARSRLRRLREGRLESAIMRQAGLIFVTSDLWKEMLVDRLPFTREKTAVLHNGYPDLDLAPATRERSSGDGLMLLHAGRFTHSSVERKPKYLFEPLLRGVARADSEGTIVLLGQLSERDVAEVSSWRERFAEIGWKIELEEPVAREVMMRRLMDADGLLLLSASRAAIPSKFFEYILTGKPILAFTPRKSSVWSIGEELKQVSLVDYLEAGEMTEVQQRFLDMCSAGVESPSLPDRFRESALSEIFMSNVARVTTSM